MQRLQRPCLALLCCSLACDVGNQEPASAPAVDDAIEPIGPEEEVPRPEAVAQPGPSCHTEPSPVATPSPEPTQPAAGQESHADRATTTVAHTIERGLGTAAGLLATPRTSGSDTPKQRRSTKPEPTENSSRSPSSPRARETLRTKPSSGEACSVETYKCGSMRVPISFDELRGSVRLKKGSWEDPNNPCYTANLIGPGFGDLDGDGKQEAYMVVNEVFASENTEGTCSYGMGDGSETLLAFILNEKCAPRKVGDVYVRDCEMGGCEELELRVGNRRIVYGRHRFAWAGGELRSVR